MNFVSKWTSFSLQFFPSSSLSLSPHYTHKIVSSSLLREFYISFEGFSEYFIPKVLTIFEIFRFFHCSSSFTNKCNGALMALLWVLSHCVTFAHDARHLQLVLLVSPVSHSPLRCLPREADLMNSVSKLLPSTLQPDAADRQPQQQIGRMEENEVRMFTALPRQLPSVGCVLQPLLSRSSHSSYILLPLLPLGLKW